MSSSSASFGRRTPRAIAALRGGMCTRCQSGVNRISTPSLSPGSMTSVSLPRSEGLPCQLPDAVFTLSSRTNESAIHMPAELPSMPH